jgi:phospholipase/lecithinase/hemolysin
MGGNDIRDALVAYASGDPAKAALILQQANIAIANNIGALYAAGARTFLVWRAPDIGLTPAIRTLGQGAMTLGNGLTQGFNAALDSVVAQLSQYPGIRIVRLDAYRLLNDLVAQQDAFGLTNVTTACVTPSVAPFKCESPDEFLFWDGIHPSKAVHAIIAGEAASSLAH